MSHNPLHPFHVLVIPHAHVESIGDVLSPVLHDVFSMVQRVSVAVATCEGVDGITHLSDDELGARQLNLVRHFKVHVIPRTPNEAHDLRWARSPTPASSVVAERVAELRRLLSCSHA